jgi:phosphohistidine phosphatase
MYLLLMRHAKSSWDEAGLKDFDRPLSKRGRRDAPKMGSFLKNSGYRPDLIISSPAKRAMETTKLVAKSAGVEENTIEWNDDFYFSSVNSYIDSVNRADSAIEILMLVGHNPLMEDLMDLFITGHDSGSFIFPTAAIACIEVQSRSWENVKLGSNALKWFVIPKILDMAE